MNEFGKGSEVSDTGEETKDGIAGNKVDSGMPKGWQLSANTIRSIQGLPPLEGVVGAKPEEVTVKVEKLPSAVVQPKPEVSLAKPEAPLSSKGRSAIQGN